jgi:hypothetical protein
MRSHWGIPRNPVPDPTPPSIHHQRRGFYVLWSALLLVGLGAYRLWITPARMESPRFGLVIQAEALPEGVQAYVWTGPRQDWPRHGRETFDGFRPLVRNGAGGLRMDAIALPMALRRWVKGTMITSRSHDLVVLRFVAPGQAPHYLFMSLREDWYQGVLRDGKLLSYSLRPRWEALSPDSGLPQELR